MTLPYIPRNPIEFVRLMEEIWSMDTVPSKDGGMTIYGSPLYDKWHNAMLVIRHTDARRTGGSIRGNESGHIYRWPNGQGIFVASKGHMVDIKTNHFNAYNHAAA